jgi:SAM-dependent methyltransferase
VGATHKWTKYTPQEAKFITEVCQLSVGDSVLDLGCGTGRHTRELAKVGLRATGVDYLEEHIEAARKPTLAESPNEVSFVCDDCRLIDLGTQFDAVVCLYDVIGSYCDNTDNLMILINIERHLKPGGFALLSVMNMELTEAKATQFFSVVDEPNRLLALRPSNTMESSGDVFDPEYYMIDKDAGIVYRKEQFSKGEKLPAELVVRDRRFRVEEIEAMCRTARLSVMWSRFVHAGHWSENLEPRHESAKEILVLCRKPTI